MNIVINEDQKAYIRANSANHTIREMQDILNLRKQNIQYFINRNNLPYKQHKDCKYKAVAGTVKIDFDNCPITGLKYWN